MGKKEMEKELVIAGITLQLALAALNIIRGPSDPMRLDTTIRDIEKTLARPLLREALNPATTPVVPQEGDTQ